jgi:hypothetical protein
MDDRIQKNSYAAGMFCRASSAKSSRRIFKSGIDRKEMTMYVNQRLLNAPQAQAQRLHDHAELYNTPLSPLQPPRLRDDPENGRLKTACSDFGERQI